MGQADASCRQWPSCRPDHAGVGFALQHLVERGRAGGDESDAGQGFEQADVETGDAGADRAEIEAGPRGNDDQGGDARLEELDVVGEQVGRGLSAAARLAFWNRLRRQALLRQDRSVLVRSGGKTDLSGTQGHKRLAAKIRGSCMSEKGAGLPGPELVNVACACLHDSKAESASSEQRACHAPGCGLLRAVPRTARVSDEPRNGSPARSRSLCGRGCRPACRTRPMRRSSGTYSGYSPSGCSAG